MPPHPGQLWTLTQCAGQTQTVDDSAREIVLLFAQRFREPRERAEEIAVIHQTVAVSYVLPNQCAVAFSGVLLRALAFVVNAKGCNWRADRHSYQQNSSGTGKTRHQRIALAPTQHSPSCAGGPGRDWLVP